MSETEKKELIEEILNNQFSYFPIKGIDIKTLLEFIDMILNLPIDFNQISIEWILYFIANENIKYDTPYKSVSDCLVDETTFEEIFERSFYRYNPIIYKLLVEAAKNIERPLMTPETQISYLKEKIEKLKFRIEEDNDPFTTEIIEEDINNINKTIAILEKETTTQK